MNVGTWLRVAVALSAISVAGGPVTADESARPYLVVVGVGAFTDSAIDPRPTADTDAKAVFDLLTNARYLGVKSERARLLLSKADEAQKAEAATPAAIRKAVANAVAATSNGDLIILAFFGRGASVEDRTCFFTPESIVRDRAATTFLGSDLEPELKKLNGQRLLMLMDVD